MLAISSNFLIRNNIFLNRQWFFIRRTILIIVNLYVLQKIRFDIDDIFENWRITYTVLLWINRKSVSHLIVDNRRRLILKRLNKFANIERYWKIIGKARIVGSKGKFDCLGRCMKMVIDNKTGWNIMDRN